MQQNHREGPARPADRLRKFDLFVGLSEEQLATIGSYLEAVQREPGDVIVRQGDEADCMYLIEAGLAEARYTSPRGRQIRLSTIAEGEYFGEIGLITRGPRTADVVALTPVKLLRLDNDVYEAYLKPIFEIEVQLEQTALRRSANLPFAAQGPEPGI